MKNLAVMASRVETLKGLDDFPTPPWAAWALAGTLPPEFVKNASVWEPAANRGHLVDGLLHDFGSVYGSDIAEYGRGFDLANFLDDGLDVSKIGAYDWIITNPPFKSAEAFVQRALEYKPRFGVAMFVRTQWIEGKGRYNRLFRDGHMIFKPFAERVALVKGRFDPDATTATSYSWFVWMPGHVQQSLLEIIPPGWKDKWVEETGWVPVKKPRKKKKKKVKKAKKAAKKIVKIIEPALAA